ncbi:MAG: hypothetical protein GY932_13415 [Arcobacter sp.]|nr:hypothetical protein [Arcobacter sp.]
MNKPKSKEHQEKKGILGGDFAKAFECTEKEIEQELDRIFGKKENKDTET